MKKVMTVLTIIVALLSIAAGVAKVMQTPQEMEFLTQQGLSLQMIVIFGIAQIIGGLLLFFPRSKLLGAIATLICFAISAFFIVKTGNYVFAVVASLPVLILAFIIYQLLNRQTRLTK